ncbi:MAG: aspartyl/asparaginyl beta-hydroxylase domain-containing protein [Gammaproteobacteria bacterium]|nr:aspartyl/asparaginyl beta-hydroxylase domain-containing protein [Gammaproteobacteria bacterium]
MRLSKPFIRLPFRFDAEVLAGEVRQFGTEAWMAHPSALPGNSAIALISSGGGDNDSFEGEKKPTPHLKRCEYLPQVMASFGEVLSRSRLMKLDAGAEVSLHVDFNYHWFSRVRIHIPIITTPAVIFHCGTEAVHMAAGECWIFDSWRRHRVVNPDDQDRVHLVIDTSGSARFWNLVARVENQDPADTQAQARFIPFEPGKSVELKTERFASLPVMAPGECTALIEDLIADFTANPGNDASLVESYTRLMRDFAHDWREAWLLHGHRPEGLPHYRGVIRTARSRLHPNRRALTASSNGIGVNAIFAQRVLNAALAPDAEVDPESNPRS